MPVGRARALQSLARLEAEVSKRLYVGNLPYTVTEDTLRDLFAQYGEIVSVSIPTDRDTGRARGFAFVEMEADAAADAAIQGLDGSQLEGRTIRVNEARPQPVGAERRGRGGRGYGGQRY